MKVLIIGGTGFIGSHLADAFDKRNDTVTIYDRVDCTAGFQRWCADVKDIDKLVSAMTGQELVVHLASNADIAKAVSNPSIDFYEGTFLTSCILEAMRVTGVNQLIYASGSGVYGEYKGIPFKETDECKPISPYGASKLSGEAMIRAYCHMFDIRADVFRFANVVGPHQTHGVGYDFLRKLKADPSHLSILGDGTQTKSYIHVSDVISAILTAIDKHDHDTMVAYNVATDDAITVRQIAHMALAVMAKSNPGEYPSLLRLVHSNSDRGWKGDVPIVKMNTDKIKELGWSAKYKSAEAMRLSLEAMCQE